MRAFTEGNDSVAKLLQLATPNGGSPLADFAQASLFGLFGPIGGTLINSLAGPAGLQLTTPYMWLYNRNHADNPKTYYSAVAGDYDPQCRWCLKNLMLGISGRPGDTIVPEWSVFVRNYPGGVHQSAGSDESATHSGIHDSQAVFDGYSPTVLTAMASRPSSRPAITAPASGSAASTESYGGELASGQTVSHLIAVDQSVPVQFLLLYPSDALDFELTSPSGQHYTPATVSAANGSGYSAGDILGGKTAMYGIEAPEVGIWTVTISNAGGTSTSLPYSVQAQFDGPALQLALPQHAAATSIGESVALSVSLQDAGHPVAQATVKAHVRRPDNHIDTLVMLDDGQWPDAGAGDGVYTVLVADNSLAGYQPVLFTASGTRTNGASFSRQQFGLISVAAGKARLTETHSDSGIDSDGDWLFNHLQFKVGVRADVAGNYRVYAELINSAGHRYPASKTVSLATGDSDIDLAFDGNALYAAHVDGPYQLAVLRLSESTPAGVLPTDQLSVPEASHPYAYTDFQHAAIEIPGESSSVGADSNGNGQFDELVFRLKADIAQAGFYEWTGVLVDADGNELGFASGSGNLAAGSNWLELHFDGSAIGAAGINGPYYVRDILISGMDTGQVVDQVWPTEPFDASEFEGFVMAPVASAVSVPSTAWWGLLLLAGLLGWLGQTRLRGNTIH